MGIDFVVPEKSLRVINVDDNQCHCSPLIIKNEWKPNCKAVNLEICECPTKMKFRKEENMLLNCNVVANRGMIHVSIQNNYFYVHIIYLSKKYKIILRTSPPV